MLILILALVAVEASAAPPPNSVSVCFPGSIPVGERIGNNLYMKGNCTGQPLMI